MEGIKLSVIVPVYRSERTLVRCINSIVSQSFHDWELLLIDDGSPDKSGIICDHFAEKDSRIRVFHKENGGVSSARNMGIENAQGERITFVDSDDEILPGFFVSAMSYDEDIVSGNIEYIGGHNSKDGELQHTLFVGKEEIQRKVFCKSKRFESSCSIVFKKDCIQNNRFSESLKFIEDTLFTIQCFLNANSVRVLDLSCYRYYIPANYAKKYRMSYKEAALHMSVFFEITDKINCIDQKFCAERFKSFLGTCFRDLYFKPWIFSTNTVIRHYYLKFSPYLEKGYTDYYNQWFFNWPVAYINLLSAKLLKLK